MSYTYEFPKANNTADFVLFCLTEDEAKVLLIRRKSDSKAFGGYWAIPGGFMNMDERLITTAVREFKEETGIDLNAQDLLYPGLIYVGLFDDPNRDPRGRTIGHVWAATISKLVEPIAADDAQDAKWWPCQNLPKNLAFDHRDIIREAYLKILHDGK